ncbi:MAG: hypothetical protein AB1894_14215 [Chloroflexota bacterium]
MTDLTYAQFLNEMMRLYGSGDYAAALALVEQHGDDYPEQEVGVAIIRVCLLNVNGHSEAALQALQVALDKGYWYPLEALRGDPDLESLQGNPAYERMVAECEARHAKARLEGKPELVVYPPAGADAVGADAIRPYPLLLAFHWRGGNASSFAPYWQGLAEQGWLVAVAQSSQVSEFDAYCWDDLETAESEAQAHLATLQAQYPLDPQRVILGGMSQGGGLAIWLACSRKLAASGFIGVAPFMRWMDEVGPQLPQGRIPGVRGCLITGGQDHDEGMFERIEGLLQAHEIPYQRQNYPDLAHAFPPDFEQRLPEMLAFIAGA